MLVVNGEPCEVEATTVVALGYADVVVADIDAARMLP